VVPDAIRPDFDGRWRYAGICVMPWADVEPLAPVPSGLYEVSWRQALAAGRLELVPLPGTFVDCGTPADYLDANMLASGGETARAGLAVALAGKGLTPQRGHGGLH